MYMKHNTKIPTQKCVGLNSWHTCFLQMICGDSHSWKQIKQLNQIIEMLELRESLICAILAWVSTSSQTHCKTILYMFMGIRILGPPTPSYDTLLDIVDSVERVETCCRSVMYMQYYFLQSVWYSTCGSKCKFTNIPDTCTLFNCNIIITFFCTCHLLEDRTKHRQGGAWFQCQRLYVRRLHTHRRLSYLRRGLHFSA